MPLNLPRPGDLLRHRGPALLLEQVTDFDGDTLSAKAVPREVWEWPAMLEAAAQCAGLLTGMRRNGQPVERVVAAYEDLVVFTPIYRGALELGASQLRNVLEMQKCHVVARTAEGEPLLEGWVTLAVAPLPSLSIQKADPAT